MKIRMFKERMKKNQVFQKLAQVSLMAWKEGSEPHFLSGKAQLLKATGAFPDTTFSGSCTQTNGYVSNERLLGGIDFFFSISMAGSSVLDIHTFRQVCMQIDFFFNRDNAQLLLITMA